MKSSIIIIILYIVQILALGFSIYSLAVSSFGWFYKDSKLKFSPSKKFALCVPAHNEENVIFYLIESIQKSNYPKDLYHIFVVADNCTDNTAEVARGTGVTVLERVNPIKTGKGYALQYIFDEIFQNKIEYDAVAIFDADNIISPNFLMEMNNKLCEGHEIIQGYIESKNPFDSWITYAYSICFWATTRLLQIPRHNLGLSCNLWGTGFVMNMDILKKIGWNATCLTEDLEFSTKLVLNNYKIAWAHSAIVYDEKPVTLIQSWNQRKRWMQGHADVRKRFIKKLLSKGLKEKNWCILDYAFSLLQHIKGTALFICFFTACIQTLVPDGNLGSFQIHFLFPNSYIWIFIILAEIIYTPAILMVDKKLTGRLFLSYITTYPIFLLTYIPIAIQGIWDKDKKEWRHTPHHRRISIEELIRKT